MKSWHFRDRRNYEYALKNPTSGEAHNGARSQPTPPAEAEATTSPHQLMRKVTPSSTFSPLDRVPEAASSRLSQRDCQVPRIGLLRRVDVALWMVASESK
jgi:hypothetical protein